MAQARQQVPEWITRLPEPLYARLFPGGPRDVDRWCAKWDELTAAGYPATCTDPETLLAVARVCRGAPVP
jgi:hypothetical protein